jgi:MFS family permease
VVFVGASVLVAMSTNSIEVIGARALQGIGGAMILPASLSVINAVFTGRSRAIAFAVWGSTIGGMAALGPLVGGYLTTYQSWHWAFLINVPIGIIVLVGLFIFVPETKDETGRKGIDIPGTLLVTLGLIGVVFALIEGQHYGWVISTTEFTAGSLTWPADTISIVLVAGIIGIAALVALVFVEKARLRAGKIVIIDLRLFKIRSFGAGNNQIHDTVFALGLSWVQHVLTIDVAHTGSTNGAVVQVRCNLDVIGLRHGADAGHAGAQRTHARHQRVGHIVEQGEFSLFVVTAIEQDVLEDDARGDQQAQPQHRQGQLVGPAA